MHGYLGETPVDVKNSPFKDYTEKDWAIYYIESYGQIDGAAHKQWVLDQVARILLGTKVNIKLAKWENGEEEYRVNTDENPSKEYLDWVDGSLGKTYPDGSREYSYDEGIAP